MINPSTELQSVGSFRAQIFFMISAAWMAGLIAVMIVVLGLDYLMDGIVDYFLRDQISNGDLRLAGVSAPLSEETARLLGILGIIGTIGWWRRRWEIHPDVFHLGGHIPWGWVFGLNAGLSFAIVETIMNGDPLLAIIPRTMAHGTYAALIMTGLMWRRYNGSNWPVVVGVALSMALHGSGNALRALDHGLVAAYVAPSLFIIIYAVAVVGARQWPEVFGTCDLGSGIN